MIYGKYSYLKYYKAFFIILFSTLFLFSIDCSSSKKVKGPDVTEWKYFKIYADADDAPLFVKIQDDLNIVPKLERFTVVVDIRDKDTSNWYIIFGDEASSSAPRFSWSQLSKDVQIGLVKWDGSNKENLQ
jgi:hypothetical protein